MSWIVLLGLAFGLNQAHAYPVIDQVVSTGTLPIKIYPDHQTKNVYWYIPQSIEPWSKDDKFKSQLSYKRGSHLTLIFRGQASVEPDMLRRVAKTLSVPADNLAPIAYDSSSGLVCQNIYTGLNLTWLFPSKIGNYMEVVPVSIRTTDPQLVEEVNELVTGNGLACTVDVTFKAVSSGYNIVMKGDLNEVYSRFEAAAHAEGLWWEVDVHTVLQNLHSSGVIRFEKFEDPEFQQTPLDRQISASWEEVTKRVIELMFKPAPKLPDGGLVGRGKAWSLRADYQRSEMNRNYNVQLNSRFVSSKTSQIGLRIAIE
jgi:hypothetical protein